MAAAVRFALEAPGRFAAVNRPVAGSPLTVPKVIDGSSDEFFAQMSYCVKLPPIEKLCFPLSHVRVSSSSTLLALRPCGDAVALGLVRFCPTEGNPSWKPPWLATLPVYIPRFNSLKKLTGAPLYPTRASFTRLRPSVDRTEPLHPSRTELWPASTGKPGKDASRLLRVSGESVNFW